MEVEYMDATFVTVVVFSIIFIIGGLLLSRVGDRLSREINIQNRNSKLNEVKKTASKDPH